MKPNFFELLFASRYMVPLWVLGGLWLWDSGHGEFIWSGLSEDDPVSYTHLTLPTNREV